MIPQGSAEKSREVSGLVKTSQEERKRAGKSQDPQGSAEKSREVSGLVKTSQEERKRAGKSQDPTRKRREEQGSIRTS